MPASFSASVEAATARGTLRETCLRSRASIQSISLKSWISPAILTGRSEASKRVIFFTPLFPARTAWQKAAVPIPFGLTTPITVITARLSIDTDSIIDAGFCGKTNVLHRNLYAPNGGEHLQQMSLGIYISVPFCRSKCTYCNFASGVFSAAQMGQYVERLIADMRAMRAFAAEHGAEIPEPVDTIYLG